MSNKKIKKQNNTEKVVINNVISSAVAQISKKINSSTTIKQLHNLLKKQIEIYKLSVNDVVKQKILQDFKKNIVPNSTKLLERTVETITAKHNSASNFYKSLPVSILNELHLDSTRLQILSNNMLQELSVEHLLKLPIDKLKQLDLTNKPTEYPIEIFKKPKN